MKSQDYLYETVPASEGGEAFAIGKDGEPILKRDAAAVGSMMRVTLVASPPRHAAFDPHLVTDTQDCGDTMTMNVYLDTQGGSPRALHIMDRVETFEAKLESCRRRCIHNLAFAMMHSRHRINMMELATNKVLADTKPRLHKLVGEHMDTVLPAMLVQLVGPAVSEALQTIIDESVDDANDAPPTPPKKKAGKGQKVTA